ncbi:hypothetical protein AB1Y20_020847 [Prymnesium parvum]|uniref:AB hydrolase-1 domain-containing protein n=1 Tax=Prymnesium parvum TaxID=97485 RepID=A0AB34JVW2_PRYPA
MYFALLLLLLLAALCLRYLTVRARLARFDTPSLASPLPPSLSIDGVEAFLESREQLAAPLKPSCASSVRWAAGERTRRRVAVVFLHGFSASPRECDPLDARLALHLSAHLLRYRLSSHALSPAPRAALALRDALSRDALLADAAAAFALGLLLGEQVVLVGCSTGGTLATWLGAQPWAAPRLGALLLVSPAYGLAKVSAPVYDALKWLVVMLPRAGRRALFRAIAGEEYRVPVVDELQAALWTMAYPTEAVAHCIELYLSIEVGVDMRRISVPTLAMANPMDKVVDFKRTERNIKRMPRGSLEVITDSEMAHNITGPLSPSTVPFCVARATDFVRRALEEGGHEK